MNYIHNFILFKAWRQVCMLLWWFFLTHTCFFKCVCCIVKVWTPFQPTGLQAGGTKTGNLTYHHKSEHRIKPVTCYKIKYEQEADQNWMHELMSSDLQNPPFFSLRNQLISFLQPLLVYRSSHFQL